MDGSPWLDFILDVIHQSLLKVSTSSWGGKMAYVAYQICLSINRLVFEVEVLERAFCLAVEYIRFDIAG